MPTNKNESFGNDLDLWAYRASAADETAQDVASIAAGATYSTLTYAVAININGLKIVKISMKSTGGNASAASAVTFHWQVANTITADVPVWSDTDATFTTVMTQNGTSAKQVSQLVRVSGKYLRLLKVVNADASYTATLVNAKVSSNG
jgi:hypothetical protein